LSGTAVPLLERIPTLRKRTESPHLQEAKLAFRAVSRIIEDPSARPVGPPVVAGRLRPADWRPATVGAARDCYRAAIALCGDHLNGGSAEHRQLAIAVLIDHVSDLLNAGLCDELIDVLPRETLGEAEVRRLVRSEEHTSE